MTAAATRRNREHVMARRARIVTASLHDADLGGAVFDTIFGVHFPPLLRGDPARELAVVRRHLAPDGRLVVLFQPFTAAEVAPALARQRAVLERHGYAVAEELVEQVGDAPAVCVTARPARREAP